MPNLSEGRDQARILELVKAVSSVRSISVLHVTSDLDHHRSVITFAGPQNAVGEAAFRLAKHAVELLDVREHTGVHPRLGVLDVLPFVPLEGATLDDCAALAHSVGERIWSELGVPVYFYEAAARRPERKHLENVRRGGFEGIAAALAGGDATRLPDIGGPTLHPSAGAVIIGARRFLIAYNVNLRTTDLEIAKEIARRIRTSSGGLPAVKALGLPLASRGLVQVSMNLTDFELTPPHRVFEEISRLASERGVEVEESELIGLIPRRAVEMAAGAFLKLREFESNRVVENLIGAKCSG